MTKARKRKSARSTAKLSTLDAFLNEEETLRKFQATAIDEVLAWQITEAMKANNSNAAASRAGKRRTGGRSATCSIPRTATDRARSKSGFHKPRGSSSDD